MGKPMQYGQVSPPAAAAGGGAGGNALGSVMVRPGSGLPPLRMTGPQQAASTQASMATPAPQLSRTPGPQLAPGQAMNQGLPVNQNALNYLNNWYDGTPAPWGAPAQPSAPANPYQNNVVQGPARPSRWSSLNAGTPAPTTASLMRPPAPVPGPAPSPQQQNPNWGAVYGNGPNQFAQGFNPIAGNPNRNSPVNSNIMPGWTGVEQPWGDTLYGVPAASAT